MSLLPHNTKVCVCPPGGLPLSNSGAPIVLVPTLMRSGTHLLIDLVLNNFLQLRHVPLYVDLDQYIIAGNKLSDLHGLGGCVVKTHYPQVQLPIGEDEFKHFAKKTKIISTSRDPESMKKSLMRMFHSDNDGEEHVRRMAGFHHFWQEFDHLILPFNQLIDKQWASTNVSQIASFIGVEPNTKLVLNPGPEERGLVYWRKVKTRLLGRYGGAVNTTIGFRKK